MTHALPPIPSMTAAPTTAGRGEPESDRSATAAGPWRIVGAGSFGSTVLAVSLGAGWGWGWAAAFEQAVADFVVGEEVVVCLGAARECGEVFGQGVDVTGRLDGLTLAGLVVAGLVVGGLVVAGEVVEVVVADGGVVVVVVEEVVVVGLGRKLDRIAFGNGSPAGGVDPVFVPKNHPSTLPTVGARLSAPRGL